MIIHRKKYKETKYIEGYSSFFFNEDCTLCFYDHNHMHFFKGEMIYVKLNKFKKLIFYRPHGPAEFGARSDCFYWYTNGICFRRTGPSIISNCNKKTWNVPDPIGIHKRKTLKKEEGYWNW